MLNPQPGGLNHNGTHAATPGSRDSLAALLFAAVVGAWREAEKASDLSLVVKVAVIDFTRKQGGIRRAYALQLQQKMTLLLGFLTCCRRRITFFFNFIYLLLHHGEPLHFTLDFRSEPRQQPVTIAGDELLECQGFNVVDTYALGEQQSLDPINVRRSLADQSPALTVRVSQVFLLDRWYAHNGPNMPLATAPGAQSTQQLLEVDTIGLHPPGAPLDFQTTRVDDEALNAVRD